MGTSNTKSTSSTSDKSVSDFTTFKPIVYFDGKIRDHRDAPSVLSIIRNIKTIFKVESLEIYYNNNSIVRFLNNTSIRDPKGDCFHGKNNCPQIVFIVGLGNRSMDSYLLRLIKSTVSSTSRVGYITDKPCLLDLGPYFRETFYSYHVIAWLLESLSLPYKAITSQVISKLHSATASPLQYVMANSTPLLLDQSNEGPYVPGPSSNYKRIIPDTQHLDASLYSSEEGKPNKVFNIQPITVTPPIVEDHKSLVLGGSSVHFDINPLQEGESFGPPPSYEDLYGFKP